MTLPTDLAHKGEVVEEWIDLRFFRPLGMRVVRALTPTTVSADQLTIAALLVGLAAGHLFLYRSPALNALGLALFIVSDVLDSADGQLARLRGSSTRFGRILDGISDNARFVNLYVHLFVRLLLAHTMPVAPLLLLVGVAGYSHSLQSAVADFLRQIYSFLTGGSGELDLPEDVAGESRPGVLAKLELSIYAGYVGRQAWWCAMSAAVARAVRRGEAPTGITEAWRVRQAASVSRCALIAQNVRFLLLALTACVGWPQGFFWLTLGPLNLALIWILWSHEQTATELSRAPVREPSLMPAGTV